MAKRTQRLTEPAAGDDLRAPGLQAAVAKTQVVVFEVAGDKFAFALADVSEILRMPRLARMPLAPASLLGLANLHGTVLPVVDLRPLLGLAATQTADALVIVVGREAPVGFTVDRIERLALLSAERIEDNKAGAGAINPELLDAVVKGAEGQSTIKIS